MNWTKTIPTENGFYWYREPGVEPEIAEIDNDTPTTIWLCGTDCCLSTFGVRNINGEFWPERLIPPTAQTSQPPAVSSVPPATLDSPAA